MVGFWTKGNMGLFGKTNIDPKEKVNDLSI